MRRTGEFMHWKSTVAGVIFALSIPTFSHSSDVSSQSAHDHVTFEKGKVLYLQHCAGCHAKDLSGGVGFNLKDGEWIHGGSPEAILASIQNGFDQAGMPGFGSFMQPEQLHTIVDYIMSKREGFEDLSYSIFELDDENDTAFVSSDRVSNGRSSNNIVNFELPEIEHYAIQFEGTFYSPHETPTFLFAEGIKDFIIDVKIDGETSEPATYASVQKWALKQGKQHLRFTYYSGKSPDWGKNIELYVINKDGSVKLFPVSSRALLASQDARYEIKATNDFVVQQKKIVKLPSYSIAVGSPQKLNYTFNTKSCAINALWQGDLLNVGPNIGGRGKDGSIPLGEWVYHYPSQLALDGNEECFFIKYRVNKNKAPEFYFEKGGVQLALSSDFTRGKTADFVYHVTDNPNKVSSIELTIPEEDKLTVSSEQAVVNDGKLVIDLERYSNFAVKFTWQGD